MRALELGKAAARAEGLRLRQLAGRTAARAVCAAIAAVFFVGALIGLHVAAAISLSRQYGPVTGSLIVAGADLVLAILFGLIAALKGPGKIEREALALRRLAQERMTDMLTVSSLVAPLLGRTVGRHGIDILLAAFRRGRGKGDRA